MQSNLFIVILTYTVPLEKLETFREEHIQFLDKHYATDTFLASEPQVPRKGGIILAKAKSKSELEDILVKDPFALNGVADYKIIEFTPTKHSAVLKEVLY